METKFREMYVIDTFTDYKGEDKHFVLAGITITPGEKEMPKCLTLGVAVCDPKDSFEEEIGKQISRGRALKAVEEKDYAHAVFSYDNGLLGQNTVSAILKQEAEYLKNHPERYIKSYACDKEKYLKEQEISKKYKELDSEAKDIVEYLKDCTDDLRDTIYKISKGEV